MLFMELFRSRWLIAIFGFMLLITGSAFLFWNEGRAVNKSKSLDEILAEAITTENLENNDDYNDKIIHIVGPIVVGEPLTEPDYNIQVLAVKLKRRVQMYQWVEENVNTNYADDTATFDIDDRIYYYTSDWRDNLIDSRNFKFYTGHQNPKEFPIQSTIQVADNVYIGSFELGVEVKDKFNTYVQLTSDSRPENPNIKLHSGLYYHSYNVFKPAIGDIRILFSVAGMEGSMYSIVGYLSDNKILPYKTSRGVEVLLVYPGELTLMGIYQKEYHEQSIITWIYRFIGWLLIFFGIICTSDFMRILLLKVEILSVMAPDPQYPLGSNIQLSLSLTLVVASIAWVIYRPMIGVFLLFAASTPFLYYTHIIPHLSTN